MSPRINFPELAAALLARAHTLVPQWLPAGHEQGGRWYIGDFSGSPGKSANVDLRTGTWIDNGTDERGGDLISLFKAIHGLPDMLTAARDLAQLIGLLEWREHREAPALTQAPAPGPATVAVAQPEDGGQRPAPPPQGAAGEKRKSVWRPIVPVPDKVPDHQPALRHFQHGDPSRVWTYRRGADLFGYVCRFDPPPREDGSPRKKEVLPLTWCVDTGDARGLCKWAFKQWEEPRPLYLPAGELGAADDARPVALVEGEKCADAGHGLLADEWEFLSWPGGGKVASMADWSWIRGRTVYLLPDCDAQREKLTKEAEAEGKTADDMPLKPRERQPGWQTMVKIGTLLQAELGCTVFIRDIPPPGELPAGWDIADGIAVDGWGRDELRDYLRGCVPFVSPNSAAAAAANGKAAASSAGAGDGERSDGWRDWLLNSAKGATLPVRDNIVLALDGIPDRKVGGIRDVRGVIAFNEFTNDVIKLKRPPWGGAAGVWEEEDELEMGHWLTREHYLPSMARSTLEESVLMVSKRHRYHPVRERLLKLRDKWDEVKRLRTWLRRCCLVEDEYDDDDPTQQYLARVGTWFVMGMCARVLPVEKDGARVVRGPGTKFDFMVIFEGAQGFGKSTLAATLGWEYSADTGLTLGDKDSYQNLQGIWVYEMGELDSLNKADVRKVKQFVSSQKDRFRASFDRRAKDYPRQVVFIGTTNEDHYLSDPTGNRRFWPVRVERPIDMAWIRENLDQLFAEALAYLDAGERFHPTLAEQRKLFDPQQMQRTVESSIEGSMYRYLYDEDQKVPHGGQNGTLVNEITLSELLSRAGWSAEKQTSVVMREAGAAMRRMGWTVRKSSDLALGRPRLYVRPPTSSPAPAAARAASSTHQDAGAQPQEPDDDCPF